MVVISLILTDPSDSTLHSIIRTESRAIKKVGIDALVHTNPVIITS
jgi:hypothetical protein